MQAYNISKRAMRAIFALAVVTASVAASAVTLTDKHTFSIGPSTLDWLQDNSDPTALVDTTQGFNLARFDSSLGTLVGVTFHIDATISQDLTVKNLSTSSGNSYSFIEQANFQLFENSTNTLVLNDSLSNTVSGSLAKQTNPNNSGASATYAALTTSKFWDLSSSDANVLSFVTGASPLAFTMFAYDQSHTGAGVANIKASFNTDAAASGWIEYSYEKAPINAVPAPPAIAAMVSGIGVAMRRRKRGNTK